MSVKYQDKHRVSIKFFPNGKIQVAGLQTIEACAYCVRKAYNRISKNNCFLSEPKVTNNKIVMINSDFKINKNIFQDHFCKVLIDNHVNSGGNITQVIFQPSKYPAINTKIIPTSRVECYNEHIKQHGTRKKFEGVISLLIFRSGSIIITGGKNIDNYLEIYQQTLQMLFKNKNLLYS